METFLRNRVLQSIDYSLIQVIQQRLREFQIAKLPLMLGKNGYYDNLYHMALSQKISRKPNSISASPILYPAQLSSPYISSRPRRNSKMFSPLLIPISPTQTRVCYSSSFKSLDGFELGSPVEADWTESKSR